jgi:hypothetical protein
VGPGYGGSWGIFIEVEVCTSLITQRALPALNLFIEPGLHASQACSISPPYQISHTQPEACMRRPFHAWLYSNTLRMLAHYPVGSRVRPRSLLLLRFCQHLSSSRCFFYWLLTSGGGPTGLTIRSSNCNLVFSRGCPRPMLMYCRRGGCPT